MFEALCDKTRVSGRTRLPTNVVTMRCVLRCMLDRTIVYDGVLRPRGRTPRVGLPRFDGPSTP